VRQWHSIAILFAACIGLSLGSPFLRGQAVSRGQATSHSRTSHPGAAAAHSGMTAEDVIKLAKAGLGEDIIIEEIRKNHRAFDLSTDQLIALKEANVSDRVVEVMLDPSKADAPARVAEPATPREPAPAPVAASRIEPARRVVQREPMEAELPSEVGVYAKKQGQWVEVPPEIVYWKSGGVLKTIATAGIRHGDVNGHIEGPSSRTSFGNPLEFLIVAPEGAVLAEYQLLRLRVNKDNREFRTITGGFLHAESGSERDRVTFDGKKIASRMYEVSFPASAGPGEYGLLPPGSSNGSGKIYSFRMTE
jgi:hypothetical protein